MQVPEKSPAAVADADRQLIAAAYAAFNARKVDALLATMHPNVEWPRSREGDYMRGHAQVCAYWNQQWEQLRTRDEPAEMRRLPDGRTVVLAQQTVHDHRGKLLHEGKILYTFTIQEGLIQRMEMQPPPA